MEINRDRFIGNEEKQSTNKQGSEKAVEISGKKVADLPCNRNDSNHSDLQN